MSTCGPAAPPPRENNVRDFVPLDELEAIAWEHRDLGVSILAAGDEWHLVVPTNGVQTRYRAHRTQVAS